jgi:glycosyltransferase involved in cell wall biosynthesis
MTQPESRQILRNVHIMGALRIGGAQRILRDLLPAIQRHRQPVELLVLSNRLDSFGKVILRNFAALGIPVRRGPTLRLGLRTIWWLRGQLADLGPDDLLNLHLFNVECVYHLARYLHRRRYRVVRTLHNTVLPAPGLNRWAFARSDVRHSITCGTAIAKTFEGHIRGERETVVSGIGFDWPRHQPAEREQRLEHLGLDRSRTHFVAAGRMGSKGKTIADFQKGYDQLIKAWRAGSLGEGGGRLHLLGDGPLRSDLEQLAAGDPTIVFHGVVDNVHEWLGACDTYVMSSRWEGLPIAGMEAAGTGIPCVFSAIDPLRELQYPTAVFYTPEDVAELSERLKARLGVRDTASDDAVRSARERFGIDRMAREYIRFYTRVT